MKSSSIRTTVAVVATALFAAACGGNRPAPPQSADVLFQRGMSAHAAGKHDRAALLLQEFTQTHLGDPRVPQALLTLGRARVGSGDYLAATVDFLRLITEFPTHPLSPEGRLGMCDAYVRLSPKPALDQEYTQAAISYCESFATNFPGTPDATRATRMVAEMRQKLARKSYDNGMFYFRRGAYDASLIYFNEAVERFPQTAVAPMALERVMEAYTRIGYVEEAAEARARLLRDYPQSPEAKALPQG